ncbi:galactose mutarotase-like isoform X1 [Neodiprion virginianus]|uniref:galactose mutarotase-like isoform X1 n=2 Tax=Neodiprion virginianus TaxID=2961670 RepID=UPI001EE6A747|nr:galactose mutarotase-like isoform X1 [Neodiprion virginianus]
MLHSSSTMMHPVNSVMFIIVLRIGASFANSEAMSVTRQPWGTVQGEKVEIFTLKNGHGFEVDVISYGATIQSIRTPDKHGNIDDVVLGFDNIEGYLGSDNPYFGATVGRVANRIGKAKFNVDGVMYTVAENVPGGSLHGGLKAWDKKIWNATIRDNAVWMTLLSCDGEEGYPGAVIATVKFSVTNDGRLVIKMTAVSTKATPINLTNHSYFNLFGHSGNATELYKHEITINADRWTVTDEGSIPTGEIRSVANSIMDLRVSKQLGDVLPKVPSGGYDYNFCVPNDDGPKGDRFVARVLHPNTGRYLEVYSDQPGVQLYTSNGFPDEKTKGIVGKNGQQYFKHGAFCLETQNYPDAVNHENFPNSILRPGQTYKHSVTYKFGFQEQ